MIKKLMVCLCTIYFMVFAFPAMLNAETVGVFHDSSVGQIKFAAEDIKTVLESKNFTVEMLPLTSLNANYAYKKVIISLANNANVIKNMKESGGAIHTGLGEQSYGLSTTATPQTSYWVLGGDANGAMYGGLQIAENINFNGFSGTYNNQESPKILRRGIKLNLPWDKKSGTYGKTNGATFEGTSSQLAIKDVWDMTFWTTWLDEMARNRYNTLSLWSCHPFTSLISLPGYEDCAIQNVTYFDGTVKIMSIEEKIAFWKQVMSYAHARGFEFYLFNWNIFTEGATGKYGITSNASNQSTITYMYKSMVKLLETYPDLDGFGITNGEKGSTEEFLWNTYGKGMRDYAIAHPERKLRLIHRFHWTTFEEITTLFASLIALPNVKLDVSFKWSAAHMYAAPVPDRFADSDKEGIKINKMKTWLTVRNDDMYYLTWGDPDFAREYVNGMLALGDIFEGFYMGCDGYNPTRTFFSKNSVTQGMLEVQRQAYMMKLWGRMSYNPNTPDEIFKNYLTIKYPTVSSENLFNAWRNSSKGIQLATELIQGTYSLDFHWYPENCGSGSGFRTIADFGGANVASGSKLCSINKSSSESCGTSMSSYQLADLIETSSNEALSLIGPMNASDNTELGVTINNIKALSYLGLYYAEKIRGATYLKANNTTAARDAMGRAYCKWMNYVNLMDAMFTGMDNQRVNNFANWHVFDANVLKEYSDLGGIGVPNCSNTPQAPFASFKANSTIIGPSETVNFTDQSTNTPTSWLWTFEGGNPATSTEQNPSVSYAAIGIYPVTLTATNAIGKSTITKAGYITVSKNLPVTIISDWVSGTTHDKVSGSNRLFTVMVMGESTGDFSATSVTYGGQTMTKQTERLFKEATGSVSYTSIFTLNEVSINAINSGNIEVAWSVTPTTGFSIYSAFFGNVDQTTPIITSATNGLTGTTISTTALAAAAGEMVLLCGATAINNTVTFNNGFKSEFEANPTWGDGIGGSKIGSGGNEIPSFTQSASGRMAICALVIKNLGEFTNIQHTKGNNNAKLYPIPVSDIVTIDFNGSTGNKLIKILNTLGEVVQQVQTQNSIEKINIKLLNLSGVAIVQIIEGTSVSNYRLIVNK